MVGARKQSTAGSWTKELYNADEYIDRGGVVAANVVTGKISRSSSGRLKKSTTFQKQKSYIYQL